MAEFTVDTLGLLLSVIVHPADAQDRDGARELLRTARRSFPFIETIFADGGYQGPRMAATVATTGCWKLEIVKRTDAHRFVALPKRWDRGANVRLDQPQPAPRPRLRALCQNRCRLRPSRHDPHHAQPFDTANPLSMNRKFLDRL